MNSNTKNSRSPISWTDRPSAFDPPALNRAQQGMFYGLLVGGAFALVANTYDVLAMRDVPLRMDWAGLVWDVLMWGGGLALLGAITAWAYEAIYGVTAGASVAAAALIVISFVEAMNRFTAGMALLLTALPLIAFFVPAIAALRWITHLHRRQHSRAGYARLMAVSILAGGVAGVFMGMPAPARTAVREVNRAVAEALSESDVEQWPPALQGARGLSEHGGAAYRLDQRPNEISLEGVDVRVTFADGYEITCLCLLRPTPRVMSCREGGW